MRALVTGGAGFIGSHVAERLHRGGHAVTVLDNLSTGYRDNLSNPIAIVEGDIRDQTIVNRLSRENDVIFHLAAFVNLPESFERPVECESVNVEGTRILLEAAAAGTVSRIVFSSTSALYPELPDEPKDEYSKLSPESPYATSKFDAELLLEEYRREHGISHAILRYFNVFGPRQRADSAYAAVIPIFIERAIAGSSFTIYGDGEQTRDFVFVEDVAAANLAAGLAIESGVYNVGTGRPTSIGALVRIVSDFFDRDGALEFEPLRQGDLLSSTASIARISSQLAWAPEHSLIEGLERTISWWGGHPEQMASQCQGWSQIG